MLTRSESETVLLGEILGRQIREPSVILLRGALGTGKTTLVRGLALGLGLEDASAVGSPSFSLVHIYRGRYTIYHVDLYRLDGESDIRSIGLEDFLGETGVTIVEWAEKLNRFLPESLEIELEDLGGDIRRITLRETIPRLGKEGKHRHGLQARLVRRLRNWSSDNISLRRLEP